MTYFEVKHSAPFAWDHLLGHLRRRAIAGVESVCENEYIRTIAVRDPRTGKHHYGWFRAFQNQDRASIGVEMCENLGVVSQQVLEKIQCLFDLEADMQKINKCLGTLSIQNPGVRVVGCVDGFEVSVRAILGQQITVTAAVTIASRLVKLANITVDSKYDVGLVFPSHEQILSISREEMGAIGIIRSRSNAIHCLAHEMIERRLTLEPDSPVDITYKKLLSVPGIGPWTANYILMRALNHGDVFLETDVGIKNALSGNTISEIVDISKKWSPWRSYAMAHLWLRNAN